MERSKKWIWIGIGIVIVLLAVVYVTTRTEAAYASPAQQEGRLEESYQHYLDAAGYEGMLSTEQVNIDITKFTVAEGMEAEIGVESVLTGDVGQIMIARQV